MTLLHHKNSNKFPNKFQRQEGVTLLLSVLIIAAITAIVFSIATIAINEIRSSGEITRSEPIIKADEAIAEDVLYKTIRGYSSLPTCATISTATVGSVNVKSCASYYFTNPYNFSLGQSVERDFYLYNPVNQSQDPGYTAVNVDMTAGMSATIYFCDFSVTDCISNPTQTQVLSPNGNPSWNSGFLNTTQKYQLIIVNGSSSTGNFSVTAPPTGLPAGTTTIVNQGSSQGSTRSLQVDIPQ